MTTERPLSDGGEPTLKTLRAAWPWVRPEAPRFLAAGAANVLAVAVTLVQPQLLRFAVDRGIANEDTQLLSVFALLYAVSAVASGLLTYAAVVVGAAAAEQFLHQVRMRTQVALLDQSWMFFQQHQSGDLLARLMSDTQRLTRFMRNALNRVIVIVLYGVMGVTLMLLTSPILTVCSLVVLILPVILLPRFDRKGSVVYSHLVKEDAGVIAEAEEGLRAFAVVESTRSQASWFRRFQERCHARARAQFKAIGLENWTFEPMTFSNNAGIAVVVVVGGLLVSRGAASVGDVVAVVAYVRLVIQPLQSLGELVHLAQEARVGLARLLSLASADDRLLEAGHPLPVPQWSSLSVEDVGFIYPDGTTALSNVNLEIARGQRVALVGPTGGGKSTLARVLTRLIDPSSGAVKLDDTDLRDLSLADVRRTAVLIPQMGRLFDGTVADNLRLARPDATEQDMAGAFGMVGATSLLGRLPAGLDTKVGPRGANLSAGERQLVALARSALTNAPVVVFDEATASLDRASEKRVTAALAGISEGRTSIVITHRAVAASECDIIVRVDNGRVSVLGRDAAAELQDSHT